MREKNVRGLTDGLDDLMTVKSTCLYPCDLYTFNHTIGSLDQKYLASLIIQGPVSRLRGLIKVVNKPNWLSSHSARFN